MADPGSNLEAEIDRDLNKISLFVAGDLPSLGKFVCCRRPRLDDKFVLSLSLSLSLSLVKPHCGAAV